MKTCFNFADNHGRIFDMVKYKCSEIEFAEDGTCTVVLYQAYYIGSSPFVAHGPSYSEYDIKRKGCLSLSFPNGTKEFEYSISGDSLSISLDDELKEYQHLNLEFIRQ